MEGAKGGGEGGEGGEGVERRPMAGHLGSQLESSPVRGSQFQQCVTFPPSRDESETSRRDGGQGSWLNGGRAQANG